MSKHRGIALVTAKLVMAGTVATSCLIGLSGHAQAEPSLANDGSSYVNGVHVDDATGLRIQEDDPRWSCVDDGNRICGPGNANGVPAGCYDDGGVIVALWPCHVVVNRDGSSDVYVP